VMRLKGSKRGIFSQKRMRLHTEEDATSLAKVHKSLRLVFADRQDPLQVGNASVGPGKEDLAGQIEQNFNRLIGSEADGS